MIFVTVGSQKFPFDRLLKKADEMVRDSLIEEEVILQTGAGNYTPRYCSYQAFFDRDVFWEMVEKCSVLITHGGTGTVIDAVRRRKKTIVVPRRAGYGEHVDDHQLQLTEKFHELNLVYNCPDTEELPEALRAVMDHEFDEWHSGTEAFVTSLNEDIRSL